MIALCFKNFHLGTLCYDVEKGEFVYDSNIEQERQAENEFMISDSYLLFNSKGLRSKVIFPEFCDFLDAVSRQDLIKKVGIVEDDNLFVKLEKISKLNFDNSGFYLKKINEVNKWTFGKI